MEAVHEFEAERDQQRDAEQHEGKEIGDRRAGFENVLVDAPGREGEAERDDREEDEKRAYVERMIELRLGTMRVDASTAVRRSRQRMS